MKRSLLLMARVLFTAFSLAAAFYGLLAYVPFTYHQVLACRLLPWLNTAAGWHAWGNLGAVVLLWALVRELPGAGRTIRWAARALLLVEVAGAACLAVHPVLPGLRDDWRSFAWAVTALIPVCWLAVLEIATRARSFLWSGRSGKPHHAPLAAAWQAALFVTLLYAAAGWLRAGTARRDAPVGLAWSLLAHLLVFLALFLVLDWVLRLAVLFRVPVCVEFCLLHALMAAAIAAVMQTVAWPALGFLGWQSWLLSVGLGMSLAAQNASIALSLGENHEVADGVELALSPALLGLPRTWPTVIAALALAGLAAAWATVKASAMDWNFTLQELIAATVWMFSFACLYGASRSRRAPRGGWIALPLALVLLYRGVEAMTPPGEAAERWAGADPSYRLARTLLAKDQGHSSFYQFLGRNTSIPASTPVVPVEVQLCERLELSSGQPPNIFIITIDSLRRDYLSPYNPKVTFTPAVDSFARESTVFRNAFTRYGGTGLSEPSIWSGAMLLHKQYVKPFRPMNALERLLETEGYVQLLSRDSILAAILTPSAAAVELDPPDSLGSYELSRSLEKMKAEVLRRESGTQPIFGYTQPQNVHIAVIRREGASVPAGESYPEFYAPYASRVRHVDEVFGQFIAFLKSRGLYDRSIVILTSDHGDSLGEEGRWGHAYTLYPEVVRIPLIVHLPTGLRAGLSADPDALAFSSDITPSLYYLLGHRPVRRHELFGVPLFTSQAEERARDSRAGYLLASSYGAVYGIVDQGGRRLYVADGVNYRSYLFSLDASSATLQSVSESLRATQDEAIRKGILAINRFYRFGEQGEERP